MSFDKLVGLEPFGLVLLIAVGLVWLALKLIDMLPTKKKQRACTYPSCEAGRTDRAMESRIAILKGDVVSQEDQLVKQNLQLTALALDLNQVKENVSGMRVEVQGMTRSLDQLIGYVRAQNGGQM